MGKSPFEFGSTVSKATFTDREEDTKRLNANLISGINTILISPRRWGKSSLVEKAANELQKEHTDVCVAHLDLFTTANYQEFLENYATEVLRVGSSKIEEGWRSAKQLFKRVVPKFSVSAEHTSELSLTFDWDSPETSVGDILDMPERLAKKNKIHLIICIDEFQNLSDWSNAKQVVKELRAHWQRHKHVTYCLYGSKRHMMTALFHGKSQPFYHFGDIMWLGKIDTKHWVSYVQKRFRSTKRTISKELAHRLVASMDRHSWYVQQLAHYTWLITENEVTERLLLQALERLISTNGPLYQREIEGMNYTQVRLLKAVANRERYLTGKDTTRKYDLGTPRNVQKARMGLEAEDFIQKEGDFYVMMDPGFALWFNREFMKRPLKLKTE